MRRHIYTIEELMLDDSFINYCLSTGAAVPSDWKAIIRDNPEQEKTFTEARKMVLALHGGLSRMEVNRQIEVVRQQLKQRNQGTESQTREDIPALSSSFVVTGSGRIRKKIIKRIIVYSTAACLLIVAGWFLFLKPATTSREDDDLSFSKIYESPLGQRQTINLPDGSTVILNSNSSLSLGANYNTGKRELWLSGNAYFKVAKDRKKPFVVYSGNIATTALGTEFFVHASGTAGNIKVDLLDGKVQLKSTGQEQASAEIFLVPGETGKSTESGLLKEPFDPTPLRHWIDGKIVFNETPVMNAIRQLETWFGTRIDVKKKGLKDRLITGEYQDKTLQEILGMICFSINCRFAFSDDIIIIE